MAIEDYPIPDFVREAQEDLAKGKTFAPMNEEVTIKFGKGLVGEPFTSKSGKELVEVMIPNSNPTDHRAWESFVISPKMIHENKFGNGVWMKLPKNGTMRLSRKVRIGMDAAGTPTWERQSREISNSELKGLLEFYKERNRGSVLSDLSDKRAEIEHFMASSIPSKGDLTR